MENTTVLDDVKEVEVTEAEVVTSEKKGLGVLGWALVITGGVLVIKGVKAVHNKLIKPAIEKRKAKKLAANNADTQTSESDVDKPADE